MVCVQANSGSNRIVELVVTNFQASPRPFPQADWQQVYRVRNGCWAMFGLKNHVVRWFAACEIMWNQVKRSGDQVLPYALCEAWDEPWPVDSDGENQAVITWGWTGLPSCEDICQFQRCWILICIFGIKPFSQRGLLCQKEYHGRSVMNNDVNLFVQWSCTVWSISETMPIDVYCSIMRYLSKRLKLLTTSKLVSKLVGRNVGFLYAIKSCQHGKAVSFPVKSVTFLLLHTPDFACSFKGILIWHSEHLWTETI